MCAKVLQQKGFEVQILDDLSTGHRLLARELPLHVARLHDSAALDALFSSHRFDAVLHFAAASQVGESVREPLSYYDNNVVGSLALLRTMLRHGVERLVFSSTAAVYGEPRSLPLWEEHPLEPINPYGRSKRFIEAILADAAAAHGLRYVALRYFNAAGADPESECGEWHEPETHLLPRLLRVAAGLEPQAHIFGSDYDTPDGTCVRDYVHVQDLAEAHLLALQQLLDGGASMQCNLGCSRGTSVREMVELCGKVTGRPLPFALHPRRAGDPATLLASRQLAQERLGWSPRFDEPERMLFDAWQFYQRRGFAPPRR
jgi:UDP-glucose-4-epimerase GalE